MDQVTISQYGLGFVWECLKRYLGGSWPVLLIFVLGIAVSLFLMLMGKKSSNPLEVVDAKHFSPGKYEDKPMPDASSVSFLMLSIVLVCAVTVCNPFLVRYFIPKFGMTTVYYRFFWIIPMTFGAAYYITYLIGSIRKRLWQAAAFVLIMGALAFAMPVNPGIPNVRIPTNVYKVNGAIPVLCDAIHEDYEKTETYARTTRKLAKITDRSSKKWLNRAGRIYPRCVFPYELEFAVRQYDPTIRILFNRNLRLFYEGNTATGITYSTKDRRYTRNAMILDALYGRDDTITAEQFRDAMDESGTQYLIAEEPLANGGFLVNAGCEQVGVVAGYTIFRYVE